MNPDSLGERGARGRRLRERFRQQTHAAVLAAAEEVFAESGLHSASMSEIARRAGVAVGTLYNHFVDREALLSDLLKLRRNELIENLDGALKEVARGRFTDQLTALVGTMFSHIDEHRGLFARLMAEERMGAAKGASETAREIHQRIDKVVKRGIKEGFLRAQGSELYASLLLGIVRGVMMREAYGAPAGTMKECAGQVIDFFLHGARARG